jgi:transcription elongation factor GreA
VGTPAERLAAIDDDRIARRTVDLIRRALSDGFAQVFADALPSAPLKRCEQLAGELGKADPDRLRQVAARIAESPDRFPEAFAWLWRAVCEERDAALSGMNRFEVTLSLLALIKRLGRTGSGLDPAEAKRRLTVMKNVLAAKDHETLRAVVAATDEETAQHVRATAANNRGLHDDAMDVITKELQETHPELFAEHVEPWEEEDVIWTTQHGLSLRQSELDKLMNEDIPRNADAIGEAAAKGDLSENAEWTAAIEERNQLAMRAEDIQAELRQARVIPADAVTTDRVTVGSRVHARNVSDDREETFTFLGPWEVDVEHGVLFYKAPLSLAFMGKVVGDRVTAGEGEHQREFVILGIESAV